MTAVAPGSERRGVVLDAAEERVLHALWRVVVDEIARLDQVGARADHADHADHRVVRWHACLSDALPVLERLGVAGIFVPTRRG